MDPDEGPDKPPISDIAPDGDLILVVGPEKSQLKVYSQCLRAASSVFNAMFGADWSEGKGLSSQSPCEIPLEEDDASALRTIFCVLHHRNTEVPDSEALTPTEILNIAIASDKYDLAVALKYVSALWLKPKRGLDLMDMGRLMTAALLLEDSRMFAAQTLELILQWHGSYLGLLDDAVIAQFVPFKAAYQLEQRRGQMRADLAELIATHAARKTECPNGSSTCAWIEKRNSSYPYGSIQSAYGPAKIFNTKVAEVVQRIQDATFEDNLRVKISCNVHNNFKSRFHEPLTHDQTMAGRLEAIKQRAAICIDCVKGTTPCKFKHG
ncbi:hypothetical protein CONLIGDRAFT_638285 [Coniochaeta ligniaria NRRL 30616]|uniref:BTB domain-containing protein n=1 Tax=Coniochaeta ligniaria NRRL 30616 TaxID=1408157 RepID=A0A1J7IN10_9PEZI|nr:hypothetical protein CONLIGDRAFT_638285 [Coniochaeta ligniaria NRRL 30616]